VAAGGEKEAEAVIPEAGGRDACAGETHSVTEVEAKTRGHKASQPPSAQVEFSSPGIPPERSCSKVIQRNKAGTRQRISLLY